MAIADCCNNTIPEGYVRVQRSMHLNPRLVAENYKKLFLNYRGIIIVSGSQPGQYSYGGQNGGLYTNAFFRALEKEVTSNNPKWKNIIQLAARPKNRGKQKPQFKFIDLPVPVATHTTTATSYETGPQQHTGPTGQGVRTYSKNGIHVSIGRTKDSIPKYKAFTVTAKNNSNSEKSLSGKIYLQNRNRKQPKGGSGKCTVFMGLPPDSSKTEVIQCKEKSASNSWSFKIEKVFNFILKD